MRSTLFLLVVCVLFTIATVCSSTVIQQTHFNINTLATTATTTTATDDIPSITIRSHLPMTYDTLYFNITTNHISLQQDDTVVITPNQTLFDTWHIDNTTDCFTYYNANNSTQVIALLITPHTDESGVLPWVEVICTGSKMLPNDTPTGNYSYSAVYFQDSDVIVASFPYGTINPLRTIYPSPIPEKQRPDFISSLDLTTAQMTTTTPSGYPQLSGNFSFELTLTDVPPDGSFLRMENMPFLQDSCTYRVLLSPGYIDPTSHFPLDSSVKLKLAQPRTTTRFIESVTTLDGSIVDTQGKTEAEILATYETYNLFAQSLELPFLPAFITSPAFIGTYNTTLRFECIAQLPHAQFLVAATPYKVFLSTSRNLLPNSQKYDIWSDYIELNPILLGNAASIAQQTIRQLKLTAQLTTKTGAACKIYSQTTSCVMEFLLYDSPKETTPLTLQKNDMLWFSFSTPNYFTMTSPNSCSLRTDTDGVVSIAYALPTPPSSTYQLTFPQTALLNSTRYTFLQCEVVLSTMHPIVGETDYPTILVGNGMLVRPPTSPTGEQLILASNTFPLTHSLLPASTQKSVAILVTAQRQISDIPPVHAFQADGVFVAAEVLAWVKNVLRIDKIAKFTNSQLDAVKIMKTTYLEDTSSERKYHIVQTKVTYIGTPRDIYALIAIFAQGGVHATEIQNKLALLYVSSPSDVTVTAEVGDYSYSALNQVIDAYESAPNCGGADYNTPRCADGQTCEVDQDCEKFCTTTEYFKLESASTSKVTTFGRRRVFKTGICNDATYLSIYSAVMLVIFVFVLIYL